MPTPAYYRGRIYTGGYGTTEMHALDAKTGKSVWSVDLSDDGPTAPACKDEVCVFNTYSCTMFGVDAETGRHLWSWWLGSPQLATPVVAGDTVYTSYPDGNGPDGANFVLAAFALKTGEPLWRGWIDSEVNATPVAYRDRVYVATQLGTLYTFGAKKGKVISAIHNRVATPPVVAARGLLFGRGEGRRDNDRLVSAHPVMPLLEQERAPTRDAVTRKPRPLLANERLITVEDGVLLATHHQTGQQLWRHELNERAAAVAAPLLAAGGSILLATAAGNVLQLQPDTGELTARYSLSSGPLASQPIAVDGWLYAGTVGGSLVAYDTEKPELTGWPMFGGGPDRRGTINREDS